MSRLAEQSLRLKPPVWTGLVRAIWPLLAAIAIGLAIHAAAPYLLNRLYSQLVLVAGINIILAVSLTVVNGFTGQFSMGHAGFMSLGGYAAATITYYGSIKLFGATEFAGGYISHKGPFDGPFMTSADFLFVASCLIGGLFSAAAGYLVGLPSLRLRGDYLAIVTLGFGEILRVIVQSSKDQIQPWKAAQAQSEPFLSHVWNLGGAKGFNLLPSYTTLFWVYTFVVITLIVCYRLKTSSSGRAFLSIREDEIASQAMGVNVTKYKIRAFVLSSFFAGLAGGLYAMDLTVINAGDLGFQKSFEIIIMVVLGGMGSISGAALAAVVMTFLPEFLREAWKPLQEFRLIIFAALLILMMILRPQGLFGVHELWEMGPFRKLRRGGGQ